jgi:hypothetical protein
MSLDKENGFNLIKEPLPVRIHSINVLHGFLASAIFCAGKYEVSWAASSAFDINTVIC